MDHNSVPHRSHATAYCVGNVNFVCAPPAPRLLWCVERVESAQPLPQGGIGSCWMSNMPFKRSASLPITSIVCVRATACATHHSVFDVRMSQCISWHAYDVVCTETTSFRNSSKVTQAKAISRTKSIQICIGKPTLAISNFLRKSSRSTLFGSNTNLTKYMLAVCFHLGGKGWKC